MPTPFPCSPMIHKCSWKKNPDRKKNSRAPSTYVDNDNSNVLKYIKMTSNSKHKTGRNPLPIVAKCFIWDVYEGSGYASGIAL